MKKLLKIPKFNNEKKEREFWYKLNLADYFEPADFKKVSFPNLKLTSQPVSIRMPEHLLARLKEKANGLDVPYQALMKQYIERGVATA